jgi:DNA-directed RNA polymerase subunit M/transcription elongation factor TFIIS
MPRCMKCNENLIPNEDDDRVGLRCFKCPKCKNKAGRPLHYSFVSGDYRNNGRVKVRWVLMGEDSIHD